MTVSLGVLSEIVKRDSVNYERPVRHAPNRTMGESEMRVPHILTIRKVKRVYVSHPKSSSARKNKKRKMAYTHSKPYRKSMEPWIHYHNAMHGILDRQRSIALED